ncbi:MAG: formimidoylglutamate deiminase [Pseudomonadota bacterium]
MTALFARHALLPQGWRDDVLLAWDAHGELTGVTPDAPAPAGVARVGHVLPGMVNLHSHSFQRALGGRTERAGDSADSFWTWRELMYRFARAITPEQMEAVAAQLFSECLRHGYTAVCEFHYLQRAPDGAPYADPAETARRVLAAARDSGIGITMLPVLYTSAGFGGQPLKPEQARFRAGVDEVLTTVAALEPARDGQTEVGVAPHSLRAAAPGDIAALVGALAPGRPIHIHIAEQEAEVAQSLAWCGARPVESLLDRVAVDRRWCLVHATHLSGPEVTRLAASGAVAGLCPSTEANLGDGLFALPAYLAAGGRFGIGSDSHVSHSAVEQLRWLEYGQRLHLRQRNIAVTGDQRRVADFLWRGALAGGAQACGRRVGALVAGRRADLLVLDSAHPNLCDIATDEVLSSFIFCGNDNLVRDVLVGGRWVVRDGRHMAQDAIAARFGRALAALRRL